MSDTRCDDISIALKAENSNGIHELYLARQKYEGEEEEFYFTLCGEYKGEKIQIDFNDNTREELEELRGAIDIMLEIVT